MKGCTAAEEWRYSRGCRGGSKRHVPARLASCLPANLLCLDSPCLCSCTLTPACLSSTAKSWACRTSWRCSGGIPLKLHMATPCSPAAHLHCCAGYPPCAHCAPPAQLPFASKVLLTNSPHYLGLLTAAGTPWPPPACSTARWCCPPPGAGVTTTGCANGCPLAPGFSAFRLFVVSEQQAVAAVWPGA